jgi:hypothetical protein
MRRVFSLPKIVRAFGRASDAVAAVEFALVVPLMLTMYIGSIELSQAFSVDQRVITIAGTVGDLVARTRDTIKKNTTLTDYFAAAQAIIAPFPTTDLKQVVTFVAVDKDGNTDVLWSEAYNGGSAHQVDKPFDLPPAMLDISKGKWVIVSEASYPFLPMLGMFFTKPFNLYHENFYLPRYGAVIKLDETD